MKYMFASDVHGSAHYCRKMLEAYCQSGADRLILLGDLLYHGPRNDLPQEYAPKQVIAMLNEYKNEIIAVRGNCEAEVDQMVLEFPVMADYAILVLNGLTFFATHGHLFNQDQMPPLKAGDILVHGHTHLLKAEKVNGHYILNPGSTSIPKGGNPATYAILDEQDFKIFDFDGSPDMCPAVRAGIPHIYQKHIAPLIQVFIQLCPADQIPHKHPPVFISYFILCRQAPIGQSPHSPAGRYLF